MNLLSTIRSDYKKYQKYGGNFFVIVFMTQGFWAIFQYRLAHFFFKNITLQPFKLLFRIWMLLWQKWIEIATGISIPSTAIIGHSFYIGHFGGIILNAKTIIGNNCNISQGVTIGVSGISAKRGVPVIGNNVYIGANAVLVGNIIVEDDALIAACSLVNKSVEKQQVVMGVPAVVVSNNGSKGYI